MNRTWSKIKDYNYSVSSDGYVRNDKTNRIKKNRTDKHGYQRVDIYKDGKPKRCKVHRLVAEAYIDNPNNKPEVNHKDGNKKNNDYSNLEWVTTKENMQHASKHNLVSRKPTYGMLGKKNPNAGRHGLRVKVIETGREYDSIIDCSKDMNIRDRGICEVLKGRQKTHRGYHFEYV